MLRGGPGGRTARIRIAAAMTMTMTAMTLGGCVDRGPGTPQETVTGAEGSYPPRVEEPTDGFEVALPSIPLLADDRLRVLGAEDRVWAEPLEAPEEPPAYWSYARDSTLNTVAVADRPGDAPLVVSLWSDGALIAVDARTGAVDWRAESPRSLGGGWSDRRDPDEDDRLLIVPGGGSPVALVARLGGLWAFDAGDGRPLWEREWSCGESGRQWAASHAVVVQEYCEQERIRTFHPRTGEEISVLEPEMPPEWPSPDEPGVQQPGLDVSGCVDKVCDILRFYPTGSTGGASPLYWWIGQDGQPVPLGEGEPRPDTEGLPPVDVRLGMGSGTFRLYATDPVDRSFRWDTEAALNTAGSETFRSAAVTSDAVWVTSDRWEEERAALLRFDPGTGELLTCLRAPEGRITHLSTAGDYLMTDRYVNERDDSAPARTHPFVMSRPAGSSTC